MTDCNYRDTLINMDLLGNWIKKEVKYELKTKFLEHIKFQISLSCVKYFNMNKAHDK